MPTVPVIDQTAMGAPPNAAPGVQPFRNAAPEQIEQTGQAVQQAGDLAFKTGETISDRLNDQVDDIKTKQAETSFLQQQQNILYGDNGFFRQRGQDAVAAYQPAKEAVVQAGQDARKTLSNPIQQYMYDQVLKQHLLSTGTAMSDYNHNALVEWSAAESKARADSYMVQALGASDSRGQLDEEGQPTGDYRRYVGQMDAETVHGASLAGFGPESDYTKSLIRDQHSNLTRALVAKYLSNNDAYSAKKLLDDETAAGNIDLKTSEVLGPAVKAEYNRQSTINFVDGAYAARLSGNSGTVTDPNAAKPFTPILPVAGGSINVTSQMGEARPSGRTHDGIDFAVPPGTQLLAPEAGTVSKVWNDDKFGGGLSMEITYPNGYTSGFAHLSATNAKEGDKVTQGQSVALSGQSGNATGPSVHYMMKDANGNYVDPRSVAQPTPDISGAKDPDVLQGVLQDIQSSDMSPDLKRMAERYANSVHSQQREIEAQHYADVKNQATDAWYKAGGDINAIPGSLRAQLRPEDIYNFAKGLPKENDENAMIAFYTDPKNQTQAWVLAHRGSFETGTFNSLLAKTQSDAQGPDKEMTATLDANQMDDILYKNGFGNLVHPSEDSDDAKEAVALKSRIMDQYVSEQNATKQPLTRDRKAEIIKQTIGDQVSVHRALWSDQTKVPAIGLTSDQAANAYVMVGPQKVKLAAIPDEDRSQIIDALRSRKQPVTQQKIAEFWVQAQKQRGKTVPTF